MFLLNDNLWPLWIVLGVVAIGVIVFLLRKFVPGLGIENEPIDEAKQAEEEVNRYIVTEVIKPEVKEDEEEE